MPAVDRYPPIYDAEDLKRAIKDLAAKGSGLAAAIYEGTRDRDAGPCCQGDVITFQQGVPVLDENCEPLIVDDFRYWLVIGNTCDFHRDIQDVPWTQIVPVMELQNVDPQALDDLQSYRSSRSFYLPYWEANNASGRAFIADFLRPIALDRRAISQAARVIQRLSYYGWLLLNACLVRYLARDDGRYD